MFGFVDVWWGEINLTVLLPVVVAPLLLLFQLLLCFKVKSLFVRMFPVGFLGVVCSWFVGLSLYVPGWDSLGYTILAIANGFMLFVCALGWGIWGLWLWNRKRRKQ